ncbi:MAG TPA: SRPBCC family protein [Solirubrobacteraceae bacterium]
MVPEQIERETVIAAPVERVWALLTEAEHLGRWFGDAGAELDLRPGGALSLTWEQYGTVHGRVVDVEAPRRFSYRWAVLRESQSEPVEGNSTLVEFTLEAEGEGTRLRVVESGFDTLFADPEKRTQRYEDNTKGWGSELAELADYAERVAV